MATSSATSLSATRAEAPKEGRQRIIAFDAFRGLAIMFVVYGHTTPFGWLDGRAHVDQWQFWWCVVLRDFLLPCLPLFLFLSGYLLGNTCCNTLREYRGYLARRVSRVAVPFLFWSCVFLALSWWRMHAKEPENYQLRDLAFRLVTGQADGPFYFILIMLQFYLATPLFDKLLQVRWGLPLIFAVHIAYVALVNVVQYWYWPDMPYQVAKTPMFGWFSIFPMGMYARRHPAFIDAFSLPVLIGACILFFTLSLVESVLIIPKGLFELGISDIRFMPLALGYSVTFLLLKTVNWPWPQWLATLGGMSFGIFFIHGFFIRRLAGLALHPTLYALMPLYQIAVAAATLIICIAVIVAARRLLPESVNSKLLAF